MPPPPSSRLLGSVRRPGRRGLWLIAASATLLLVGCAATRLKTASDLARASEPFQAVPPQPPTHRLLVVGDSTAVGTGASSPALSLPGLIARDHPGWAITNRAADGAKLADVVRQLAGPERFDSVLVLAGGNDVIRLSGAAAMGRAIDEIVARARAIAPRVVLMPSGNVGHAPFFWPPLSWWMSARSRTLHRLVRETAAASPGVVYVNLYREGADDPFLRDPKRLHAADDLHPSDDGYRQWRATLRAQGDF
ncbi:MAG: GDSL-type esterase/lipase family protein [Rubrivivax sp.]